MSKEGAKNSSKPAVTGRKEELIAAKRCFRSEDAIVGCRRAGSLEML